MLFNSYEFIFLFLPITLFFYFFLNRKKFTKVSMVILVFSSLFFYSWWNPAYLPLILVSMIFNYLIGTSLAKEKKCRKLSKKKLLSLGIIANIGTLSYYKYSEFIINNINFVLNNEISHQNIELPLAISFFTFQQIAYLVDSYNGETKEYKFLNYGMFVTFFPQLIAGPIVHHREMMPQFSNPRNKVLNYKNIAVGLFVFSIGLFKKVVIADTFAIWATNGFDFAETLHFIQAWMVSLSYSFQLYFDFSGYADMAIGVALLFNIKLPINFNSPYKASNIQDFWRRWHITLGRFLRDYIYIPLGGSRKTQSKTYINLMATFIIGGIWHGAGWTFIFWGFLHGLALVIQRLWSRSKFKVNSFIGWIITFNFVNLSWIFFRSENLGDAVKVLKGMFGFNGIILPSFLSNQLSFLSKYGIEFGSTLPLLEADIYTPIWLIVGFLLILLFKNSVEKQEKIKLNFKTSVLSSLIFLYAIYSLEKASQFLYFNF